jgi:Right handed beta helix region
MKTTAIGRLIFFSGLAACGGGAPTMSGNAGAGGSSVPSPTPDQTLCGAVPLAAPLTIAPGKTAAICAGSTVTAAAGAGILVQGTLLIQGTREKPVKLVGAVQTPGSWGGIVLSGAGSLRATFVEVHHAAFGLDARPGSTFEIDHILMDSSTQLLLLETNGTLSHGVLHGLSSDQSFSPVAVVDASPKLVDTVIDQGLFNGADMVIVTGAASAPVFDHVEVADSHCAFHFNEGIGVTISNSWIHHNAYGLMVGASTNGKILHNNFEDNAVHLGSCLAGVSAQVTDNYFAGPPLDGSCQNFTVTNSAASPHLTNVGPRP